MLPQLGTQTIYWIRRRRFQSRVITPKATTVSIRHRDASYWV